MAPRIVEQTEGAEAEQLVRQNALAKAIDVIEAAAAAAGTAAVRAPTANGQKPWVLGVDTLVELEGRALGKPHSAREAEQMLTSLSGRIHRVVSGIALLTDPGHAPDVRACCTEVRFRTLSGADLEYYLDSGEWSGVAGGYRIQGRGAFLIEWIRGSYSNVVGLPLETFYAMLRAGGYDFC